MDSNDGYIEFHLQMPRCVGCIHWVVDTATGVGRCNECIAANRYKGCGLYVVDISDVHIEEDNNDGQSDD